MKSIVLLSGGLDSSVALAQALRETDVALCLTFDYGQKSAAKEKKAAAALAAYYKTNHRVLELNFLKEITTSALVAGESVPEPGLFDLDDRAKSGASAVMVWVPNRNGLFVNIAASFAEAYQCDIIVAGFNREEAATFPDNSREYVSAANLAMSFSTLRRVRLVSYTQQLDKAEIVKLGLALGLPFQYVWSCYRGGEKMCGRCESCMRLKRAVEAAGLELERLQSRDDGDRTFY
ncbi:7-cyano-7-deazaguanine synthase QueC [Pelotomaculum propionicicum]|uniref:7-cyano-7-deazaguanine synthase n=1 Tax=Pelotomaculum propionicicum TaxID=258475 RepID=A0A4Y7RLW4_9FIRM|nr:7-cyano-7-deazaguanine synthase QueC [Pelotomaculum propionicicum]TEB09984.1 7-cyano-7-deazaguanine synthase [Pelotomaculum propionicicum]